MEERIGIPVSVDDLPTEGVTIDDTSLVYPAEFTKFSEVKADRNGKLYIGVTVQITDGDYEGMSLQKNYVKLPPVLPEDPSKKDKIRFRMDSEEFGHFAKCFRMQGIVPSVQSMEDATGKAELKEFLEKHLNTVGKVTVENSEFPKGSGRMRSAVNNFIH